METTLSKMKVLVATLIATSIAAPFAAPARADDGGMLTIHTAVNPAIYANLPFIMAIDKGYFRDEGLSVEVKKYHASAVTQMPLVARGDLDIANMVAGPALFNQVSQGFDIRIVASMAETHPGWHDGNWVVVRDDVWKSGAIRTLKDIKGHAVDGATKGAPINFLMNAALLKAGLTKKDVKYSERVHSPSDMIAVFRNKAVEVMGTIEPSATQLVDQGLAHRLASENDVVPWLQDSFFVSSSNFMRAHPQAAVKFLKGYLRAAREVVANGPKWMPEYTEILHRWSGLPQDVINKVPGVPYYGQFGRIKEDSLAREEKLWQSFGDVKKWVNPSELVDTSAIVEARKEMGIQ